MNPREKGEFEFVSSLSVSQGRDRDVSKWPISERTHVGNPHALVQSFPVERGEVYIVANGVLRGTVGWRFGGNIQRGAGRRPGQCQAGGPSAFWSPFLPSPNCK